MGMFNQGAISDNPYTRYSARLYDPENTWYRYREHMIQIQRTHDTDTENTWYRYRYNDTLKGYSTAAVYPTTRSKASWLLLETKQLTETKWL